MNNLNNQIIEAQDIGQQIADAEANIPPTVRLGARVAAYLEDMADNHATRGTWTHKILSELPERFLSSLSVIHAYGTNQTYLYYSMGLLVTSLFTNPSIPYYVFDLGLLLMKILQETYLDIVYRDQYNYSSRVTTDVGLALFFATMFGLIYSTKQAAGAIDDTWFQTWQK